MVFVHDDTAEAKLEKARYPIGAKLNVAHTSGVTGRNVVASQTMAAILGSN